MEKVVVFFEDGSVEEFTTFFLVGAVDYGTSTKGQPSTKIRRVVACDNARLLVFGAMLRKASIEASHTFEKLMKAEGQFSYPFDEVSKSALQHRISWSES